MSVVNVWSGAVGPSGATVKAKVTGTSCRLAVADNAALSGPVYVGPVTPTAQGIATFVATGLPIDTQYWYAVEDDGVLDLASVGQFHTHGVIGDPYSFTFAHGTCAGGNTTSDPELYPTPGALRPQNVSSHPVFDDIAAAKPLFFAHGGDLFYYNITNPLYVPTNDPNNWRRAFDDVLMSRQRNLYLSTPIQYMWDNHDFAQPGDDSTADGTAVGKDNAAMVWRERVPHYPLANPTAGGIYHSFQIGRVLWLASDIRYYRASVTSASPRTMMGSAQLAWLDNLLATSDAELLIWQQGQNWENEGNGGANWGSYSEERDQLVDMFAAHGWLSKMFMITGDSHAMAIDTGGGNRYGGFPIFMFSSLDSNQTAGPTYDLGRRGSTTGGTRGQWGTIRIQDNTSSIRVTGTGMWWTA